MASPETTSPPRPFQFGLRSIFLATTAIAVVFALVKLNGFLIIPIIHALVGGFLIVLTKRRAVGGYVVGLVLSGVLVGLKFSGPTRLTPTEIAILFVSVVTLAGWLVGAIGAMIRGYPGLGWSFLMCGGVWFWVLAFLAMASLRSM